MKEYGKIIAMAVVLLQMSATRLVAMHAGDDPALKVTPNTPLGIAVSIRASGGVINGEAQELVYGLSSDAEAVTESQLVWDIKNVRVAGTVISMVVDNDFNVNFGWWKTISKGNGGMVNSDWLDGIGFGPDDWAFRSIHDVFMEDSYMFDLNGGIRFVDEEWLGMSMLIGYKRDSWRWSDSAKEMVRTELAFRDAYYELDGSASINYHQVFEIPYFGLSSHVEMGPVSLGVYALVGIGVTATDEDYHIWRNDYFTSTLSGGRYLAAGASAQLNIVEGLFITVSADYQRIPEFSGDLTMNEGDTGKVYEREGGAGVSHESTMYSAALGWKF